MNWGDFHFLRPFWLLALIPWMLLWMMIRRRLGSGSWTEVCDRELLPYILQEQDAVTSHRSLWLAAAAGLMAIIALAGPVWERLPTPVFRNVSGLVIALDLSRSMDAEDVRPSRVIRARYKIADLLRRRLDGQTALLVYAGAVFTVTPLTDDVETINSQLSALSTSIMPSQGSRSDLALAKAAALLRQAGLRQGQILLVTDGVDVHKTLPLVEQLGDYRLSVLGIGTPDGAPIKIEGGGFFKNRQGEIVVAKLRPEQLRRLASAGGGIYRQITPDGRDIDALTRFFQHQGNQEGNPQDSHLLLGNWLERGPWLLLLILPVAALAFRRGILGVVLLLMLPLPRESQAMDWRDLWRTTDQQAQQSFDSQRYKQAAELFQTPEWKAAAQYRAGQYRQVLETLDNPQSSREWYNKGNAHARLGHLEEAIAAYQKALRPDPGNDDARYNKELLERQRKKQQQEQGGHNQDKQARKQGRQHRRRSDPEHKDAGDQQHSGDKAGQKDAQEQPRQDAGRDRRQKPASGQKQDAGTERRSEDTGQKQAQQSTMPQQDETRQANEQWLKRIPDDPAGLLRRKFKYQYSRMKNTREEDDAW